MINNNITSVVAKVASLNSSKPNNPEGMFRCEIPTLEKGIYRVASPMLKDRFEICGRWENSTHGTWLSISDMEMLWDTNIEDKVIDLIKYHAECLREDWPNHAYSLFNENRLSLFSGSDVGNESIFMLWLDFEDEPEFWVYDSNGESRYKNFNEYLLAYLSGDLSASENSWRAK